jgi:di/tricarboxylate transporter
MPIEGLAIIGAAIVDRHRLPAPADEAYKSIEWPILVLIFGMLAISIAMRNSGLDQLLAGAARPRSARACRHG